MEWVFLPLRTSDMERPEFSPLKKLIVYEYPEPGCGLFNRRRPRHRRGKGSLPHLRHQAMARDALPDIQVAEFTTDDLTNVEIYAYVAAIAALYGMYMDEGRHPKIIIEQKRKYGDTCQHQLNANGDEKAP
jgi:hypothetical protein